MNNTNNNYILEYSHLKYPQLKGVGIKLFPTVKDAKSWASTNSLKYSLQRLYPANPTPQQARYYKSYECTSYTLTRAWFK